MKNAHRTLVLIAFAFSGLLGINGCYGGAEQPAMESEVVSHSEQELSNLSPGESLRLDLTLQNKIYQLTYTHPAILDRVVVVARDGEHSLVDWAGDALDLESDGMKQVVLTADSVTDAAQNESTPINADCAEQVGEAQQGLKKALRIAACKCPCCMEVAGHLVCCG